MSRKTFIASLRKAIEENGTADRINMICWRYEKAVIKKSNRRPLLRIAHEVRKKYGVTLRELKFRKEETRKRGRSSEHTKPEHIQMRKDFYDAGYAAGYSFKEMADFTNCTHATAWHYVYRNRSYKKGQPKEETPVVEMKRPEAVYTNIFKVRHY